MSILWSLISIGSLFARVRFWRTRELEGCGLNVAIPYGEVSRDDVAATIAELIEQPTVNRVIIELTSGSVPVADAVRRLARS